MEHISIIIVHYNTIKDTRECLESLSKIKADDFKYNIIVVDNGSKEQLILPKSTIKNSVELIRSEANLGFTGGNNLGISHAIKNYNSDYFLLLNSDTYVEKKFLEILYQTLKNNDKAGLVSPKIYFAKNCEFYKKSYDRNQKGRIIWYAGGSWDSLNLLAFHRGVDELDRQQFQKEKNSDFATGCCCLIKRDVIERAGILDKKYFLYLEDVDLSFRARNKGFEVLFEPKAIIWHKNAGSSEGSGSEIHRYYQSRNRLLFVSKFAKLKAKLLALKLFKKLLFNQSRIERKAALDFLLARFGKQAVF
ncbi:MAG: glycosyltransferase family 2 protein [Candidatus Woesebacteria bacterium]|jgi:GT2 family glycosyltransferase